MTMRKRLKKYINKLKKKLIDWVGSTRKYFSYQFALKTIRSKGAIELLLFKLKAKSFIIWSVLYFPLLLLLISFLGKYLPFGLSRDLVANLYFTEATILVTVLTIGFSFSILLIQHASQNLPSGFYKLVSNYLLHDVIFFLSSCLTLSLLGFSLIHGRLGWGLSGQAIQISLFISGLGLYLMFYLYFRIREKIDPFNVLQTIKDDLFKHLDNVKKRAEKYANLIELNPKVKKEFTKEETLAYVFNRLSPNFDSVNNKVQYMFDYHDKILSNQEKRLALFTLDNIVDVIQKYFEVRKDSSLILPYGLLGRTSDSQSFLTPILERFVSTGKSYIREDNNEGITKIINALTSLTLDSSKIKYTAKHQIDNPIFAQCRGYLGMLMDVAISSKSEEALFQGARAYKSIGLMSIDKKLRLDVSSTNSSLYKIGLYAIANSQKTVFETVIDSYDNLLRKFVSIHHFSLEIELKDIFQHVNNLILYQFLVIKKVNSTENAHFSQTVLARPYKTMESLLYFLAKDCKKLKGKDLEKTQSSLIVVAEQLRSSLRHLSEKMQSADHLLVGEFARITGEVGSLLVEFSTDKKWTKEKKELENIAVWYIHQPYWFTHKVKVIKSNLSFNALPKSVAQIGLVALENDNEKIAKEAIKSIFSLATLMLEKEERPSYGFTEPRIMELACHIGIVALKKNKKELVTYLKSKIKEFEKKYKSLWFPKGQSDKKSSLKKNQLRNEVIGLIDKWRNTTTRRLALLEREESFFLQMINEKDIKFFIKTIWRVTV